MHVELYQWNLIVYSIGHTHSRVGVEDKLLYQHANSLRHVWFYDMCGWMRHLKQIYNLIGSAKILAQSTCTLLPDPDSCEGAWHARCGMRDYVWYKYILHMHLRTILKPWQNIFEMVVFFSHSHNDWPQFNVLVATIEDGQ